MGFMGFQPRSDPEQREGGGGHRVQNRNQTPTNTNQNQNEQKRFPPGSIFLLGNRRFRMKTDASVSSRPGPSAWDSQGRLSGRGPSARPRAGGQRAFLPSAGGKSLTAGAGGTQLFFKFPRRGEVPIFTFRSRETKVTTAGAPVHSSCALGF